ncbi:MAG TPA: hypothetical protein VIG47_08605, partial [Gemmatimonadaceae bacterium]
VILRERLLPCEDHGNRYVVSAFGILAATMQLAARQLGLELDVRQNPDLDPPTLNMSGPRTVVGNATIVGTCEPEPAANVLNLRRTSRLPYHDRPVNGASLSAFERVLQNSAHRLIMRDDPEVVRSLLHLNAQAIVDNLHLDDEREEISRWYRMGTTPRFGDGLWQIPMNQPAWELRSAFMFPHLFHLPGLKQFAIGRYLRTQQGTRHIGLLCGPFQEPVELFEAGQLLMKLWLDMSRENVYMQPMGSMLTNPAYAREIARRFGVDDCWLVFRFGYSDPPPQAPRLESILIHE